MKIIKKLISFVLVIILIAGGFVLFTKLNINFNNNEEQYKLDTVKNISYDDKKYIISWDEVEEADRYYIAINADDDYIEVTQNSHYYVVKDLITNFKIQAAVEKEDENGLLTLYKSEWSKTYTYTIEGNEVTYGSVSAFVSTMLPSDYKLIKFINISIDDNQLLTNAVFERDGELKVYELSTKYEYTIESLSDVVSGNAEYTRILDKYDIVNYDSANSLLKSNSYVGQMEEYRQQGYKFEVISQQVGRNSDDNNAVFNIYAIYKLTKNDEIKYINSMVTVVINEESSYEKTNYTTRVENPEDRLLYEKYFKVLSGDEIDLAKDMEEAKIPLVFEE